MLELNWQHMTVLHYRHINIQHEYYMLIIIINIKYNVSSETDEMCTINAI